MVALDFSYNIFLKHIRESFVFFGVMLGVCVGFLLSVMAALFSVILFFMPLVLIVYLFPVKMFMTALLILASFVMLVVFVLICSFFIVYVQAIWIVFFSEISMQKIEENIQKQTELAEKEILDPEIA
jgi:hypothetical protein